MHKKFIDNVAKLNFWNESWNRYLERQHSNRLKIFEKAIVNRKHYCKALPFKWNLKKSTNVGWKNLEMPSKKDIQSFKILLQNYT